MSFLWDYFAGQSVFQSEIGKCVEGLVSRWRTYCRLLPSGEAGWYRRLRDADRLGVVATANAIEALALAGSELPSGRESVRFLLSKQRGDGGWSYVSNLADVTVIDATSAVLCALVQIKDDAAYRDLKLPASIDAACSALEALELSGGGWGLAAGSPYRTYSTALAIRALCCAGRRDSPATRRALHRLVACQVEGSGAWQDGTGRLSIPTSAEALCALVTAAKTQGQFGTEIRRGRLWLLGIARGSNYWTKGPLATPTEEVEVHRGASVTRVEYGFSPRPMALRALLLEVSDFEPEIVLAVRSLLNAISSERWEEGTGSRYAEPTSWSLYDVTVCLQVMQKSMSRRTMSLWTNRVRVIEHLYGEGWTVGLFKRHWTKLLALAALAGLVALAMQYGLISGIGMASVVAFVGAVSVHIAAHAIIELIHDYGRKRELGGMRH